MPINIYYIYTSKKVGEPDNELYLVDGTKHVQQHIPFGVANDKNLDEAIHEMSQFIKSTYKNMNEFTIMSSHSITIKKISGKTESKMNYRLKNENLEMLMNYISHSNDS